MSDMASGEHRDTKTWITLLALVTSVIGVAALIIAAMIGVGAKLDRKTAATALKARDSLIRDLQRQLQDCPAPRQDATLVPPTGSGTQQAPEEPGQVAGGFPKTVQQNGFLIELQACSLQGDELDCKLLATAQAEDASLELYSWSRLVESDGTEMLASRIQFGKNEARGQSHGVRVELVRGVPVKMGIGFAGLNPDVNGKTIALIELVLSGFRAQFKDVPIG